MHRNNIVFNKYSKRVIAFTTDCFSTILAWSLAEWIVQYNFSETLQLQFWCILLGLQSICYIQCWMYRGIWRFASIPDLVRILKAVFYGNLLCSIIFAILDLRLPLNLLIVYSLLLILFLAGPRLIYRWLRDYQKLFSKGQRLLIVGAGSAGEGLIRELYRSEKNFHYLPIAFVDDDKDKIGCEIHGVRVLGTSSDIPRLTKQLNIDLILIAIPSASGRRMRELVGLCERSQVTFRTLPSIKDIADGIVKVDSIRNVTIEDLLGREEVNHELIHNKEAIVNQTILVTGGGGSIGSELCRQLCKLNPQKLIVVDNNEYNLYAIEMNLRELFPTANVEIFLYDVTDEKEMHEIFSRFRPTLVLHVAAYKHVPLLENHPQIAIFNNIIGTKNVIQNATKFKAETFVLISTDKAVNPTSIMGATKRACEILCQTYNAYADTRFITVRFGNVLESTGSVLPLFRKQLLNGGPLTVTHPDISRYFMTISEAAQLILQATTMCDEGEVFVLDMGEQIKIRYLAEQIIKLHGKKVGTDIEIQYTGLRPGEKLYEELFYAYELLGFTSHPKIRQAKVKAQEWFRVQKIFQAIEEHFHNASEQTNVDYLLKLLFELVPEYCSMDKQKAANLYKL